MEEAKGRLASKRQLAYIRQLRSQIGDVGPEVSSKLSSAEASELIGKLVGILKHSEPSNGNGNTCHIRRINEPRLGMAMKECFRLAAGYGWDIESQNRDFFIEKVIRTYHLFTEIAERVENERKTEVPVGQSIDAKAMGPGIEEAQAA
jgi:hypothetical protein